VTKNSYINSKFAVLLSFSIFIGITFPSSSSLYYSTVKGTAAASEGLWGSRAFLYSVRETNYRAGKVIPSHEITYIICVYIRRDARKRSGAKILAAEEQK